MYVILRFVRVSTQYYCNFHLNNSFCRGYSMQCRIFSSILSLCLQNASSTRLSTPAITLDIAKVPQGGHVGRREMLSRLRITGLDRIKL